MPAAKDRIERRRERVSVLENLGLTIFANVGTGGGLILDLSEDGMSVQLAGSMPVLLECEVQFELDDGATPVKAKARTVWRQDGVLGMRLVDFEAQCRDQLSRWLSERCDRRRSLDPGRTEAPAPPPPTPPQKIRIPVAFDITGRPVEFADEEEVVEDRRQPKFHAMGRTLASTLKCMRTEVRAEFHAMGRTLASTLKCMRTELAVALVESWNWAQTPVRKFLRQWAGQRALRLEAEQARKRKEMEGEREEARLAECRRQEQIAAEQHAEQERARVTALREARIVAEREAARQEQLQQLITPPAPEVAPEPANGKLNVLAPPAELTPMITAAEHALRQPQPRRSSRSARPSPVRRRGAPIAISGTAVRTGLGVSLVVLLGFIAYANRRAPSTLLPAAPTNNGSVTQQVPFGAITIAPPVVPKASSVAPVAISSFGGSKESRQSQGTGKRRRPQSQSDSLAKDEEDEVVVRHFQTPRPQQPRQQPRPSTARPLARYSDME